MFFGHVRATLNWGSAYTLLGIMIKAYTKSLGEGVTVKSEILALLEGLL